MLECMICSIHISTLVCQEPNTWARVVKIDTGYASRQFMNHNNTILEFMNHNNTKTAKEDKQKHGDSTVGGTFIATMHTTTANEDKTSANGHLFPAPLKFNVDAGAAGWLFENVAIIDSVRVGGVSITVSTKLALPQCASSTLNSGGKGGSHHMCEHIPL